MFKLLTFIKFSESLPFIKSKLGQFLGKDSEHQDTFWKKAQWTLGLFLGNGHGEAFQCCESTS